MSVFKQFTAQDVIVTPFYANKGFSYTGAEISSSAEIDFYIGLNVPSSIPFTAADTVSGLIYPEIQRGIYGVAKNLYYTNYISSSIPTESYFTGSNITSRYENYLQATVSQSRYFPTLPYQEISVISIPSKLYGENIVPGTFKLIYNDSPNDYIITDDGEGNIRNSTAVVGNIFYAHGLVVLTDGGLYIQNLASNINSSPFLLDYVTVSFSSSITIYENQYRINIRDNEFNFTLNPSVMSGSISGSIYSYMTGSDFAPYATTVGLYNDNKDLLAVAKLAFPLKMPNSTDLNILVNFDM